jgi:hypothetical protein
MSAMWASVSVFCTSAGSLAIRSGVLLSVRNIGSAFPFSIQWARADSGHEPIGGTDQNLADPGLPIDVALVDGAGHGGGNLVSSSRDTYDDLLRATDRGQDLGSIENEVRSSREQDLVLVAGGLAFHTVDNDDSPDAVGVGRRKFDRRREGATAPAGKTRLGQFLHEPLLPSEVWPDGQGKGTQGMKITVEVDWVPEHAVAYGERCDISHEGFHLAWPQLELRQRVVRSGTVEPSVSLLSHFGRIGDPLGETLRLKRAHWGTGDG